MHSFIWLYLIINTLDFRLTPLDRNTYNELDANTSLLNFSPSPHAANVHGLCEEYKVHITQYVTNDHLHAEVTDRDVCPKYTNHISACLCLHTTVGYSLEECHHY